MSRYDGMVAEAQALSGQEALPAHTQKLAASWLDYHARCEPICRQIRELPARADALTADCPERPATLDSLRGWRQRAEPLLAETRAMLAEDGAHAPHLAAMPGERKALVKAKSSLESALLAVEARELRRDWHTHVSRAMTAHAHPFYVVGHAELIDRLQQLRNQPCRYGAARQRTGADRLHPRRSPAAEPSPLTRPGISGPDRALPHPAAAAKRTRPYPEIGAPRRPLLRRMARHRRTPSRDGEGHRR